MNEEKSEQEKNIRVCDISKKISESYENSEGYTTDLSETLKELVSSIDEFSRKLGETISNSIKITLDPVTKITSSIIKDSFNLRINISPFFEGISKSLEKIREDPNSIINWCEYADALSDYFWLPPYMMKSEVLKNLLETVNSEKELDEKLEEYFSEELINKLFEEIIGKVYGEQKKILIQIRNSYKISGYALANVGLFSVIDYLCSYFIKNKKENHRSNLFMPILESEDMSRGYSILVISMLNSNINFLYEYKDFNQGIDINTHKKAKRHPSQHGRYFSNNKIDTIMLLHTTYYLLISQEEYSKYKNSLYTKQVGKNRAKIFYLN